MLGAASLQAPDLGSVAMRWQPQLSLSFSLYASNCRFSAVLLDLSEICWVFGKFTKNLAIFGFCETESSGSTKISLGMSSFHQKIFNLACPGAGAVAAEQLLAGCYSDVTRVSFKPFFGCYSGSTRMLLGNYSDVTRAPLYPLLRCYSDVTRDHSLPFI